MKIKKIKKEYYEGKVYNFHCTPSENYYAKDVLVHNCYKSNTCKGFNMSFDTFKQIFERVNKNKFLTQIAFGADSQAKTNPDLFKMMEYTRDNGVIPNITVAQIDKETAIKLANLCGAVSVSRYEQKDACYDSVKLLTDAGLEYCNMHYMISEETYEQALETIDDILTDKRLEKLNSLIFLSLKQKGRGEKYNILSQEKFNNLMKICLKKGIKLGFDSCSSVKVFTAIEQEKFDIDPISIEPCESICFSSYINYKGEFYPCSFAEGYGKWKTGINVLECEDFKEVWYHKRAIEFRKQLLTNTTCNGCRQCQLFKV